MTDSAQSGGKGIAADDITGVVLAGGRADRMDGVDKGLLPFAGEPLVAHVLRALQSVAGRVTISANRSLDRYREFGCPVFTDENDRFNGPLAGLLAAMGNSETPLLLTAPCDSPLITGAALTRLVSAFGRHRPDACVAHDGERIHPVFLLIRTSLEPDLRDYLSGGGRRMQAWLRRYDLLEVDCSVERERFMNINTPEELREAEAHFRQET